MAGSKPRVWTTSRKLWGNLFPFGVGLAAAGVWAVAYGLPTSGDAPGPYRPWESAIPWFLVSAWLALSVHPFALNRRMRAEMAQQVTAPENAHFVGIATPGFQGLLDTHEDVGFLWFEEDALRFAGERHNITIPRENVHRIRFGIAIHTWVGLGGWMRVEGTLDGKRVRLVAESREAPTMFGCFSATRRLIRLGRDWQAQDR